MIAGSGTLNEFGRAESLVLKHPREAFGGDARIHQQWRDLGFTHAPAFTGAVAEFDRFQEAIAASGAEVRWLPAHADDQLDSIYVRDASVPSPRGMILCRMGKSEREAEPDAQGQAFAGWGVPVIGAIRAPGTLEGGDVVWLDDRTAAVGCGYRTNAEGIRQFAALVGPDVEVITVGLPHWRGPDDVFHLMSMLSPVDANLAVVYSPLMPVAFRELLRDRGMSLVEVPDGEFDTMGANVLATAPRACIMVAGNPRTRTLLEAAGAEVTVYEGEEISLKGGGGPTCLTRPLIRLKR